MPHGDARQAERVRRFISLRTPPLCYLHPGLWCDLATSRAELLIASSSASLLSLRQGTFSLLEGDFKMSSTPKAMSDEKIEDRTRVGKDEELGVAVGADHTLLRKALLKMDCRYTFQFLLTLKRFYLSHVRNHILPWSSNLLQRVLSSFKILHIYFTMQKESSNHSLGSYRFLRFSSYAPSSTGQTSETQRS